LFTRRMPDQTFNPITETYTIKHKSDKNKQFENVFEEIANSDDNRDLVLLCGKEKLSYHSEVVAAVFPFVKKFVQNAKSCSCSVYIQNKAEMFITLDGVDPDTLKQMMKCIYKNEPMRFSRQKLGEVRDIFKMLGADDKLFALEKDESNKAETKVSEVKKPEAKNGDVFRKVLGISGPFDISAKRKSSEDDQEPVTKKRVIDINSMEVEEKEEAVLELRKLEEAVPELKKKEETVPELKKKEETVPELKEKEETVPELKKEEPSINDAKVEKPEETIRQEPSKPVEPVPQTQTPTVEQVPEPTMEATPPEPKPAEVVDQPNQKPKDTNLQMILPHLTVTTIKQEPKEASESLMPVIKQEPVEFTEGIQQPPSSDTQDVDSSSMLRCPLAVCSSEILFKTRSEILLHLTQAHYTEGLLELFPFNKGQPCKICVDEKKPKVLIAQVKNRYIAHIGVNHEVVLDLLPAELKEVLMVLPKRIKRLSRPETPLSKSEVDITLDEAPAPMAPSPVYPSYPTNYNYPYPPTTSYPAQSYDQSAYPPPPDYPAYNSYPQYPVTAPSYPNYGGYSFESVASNPVVSASGSETVKLEPTSVVKEEPKVVIKQEPLEHSDTVYKCTLCTARSFNQRSDLLFHLSITHFSRNLNQLYPFKDSQVCPLCNQFRPKNMSSHISHVGLKHEEVIKFLPADLASTLAPTTGDSLPPKPVEKTEAAPATTTAVAATEKPIQKPEATAPPASEEEPSVQCEMCKANNKMRLFTKRSEFLKHLSLLHFGKALLQAFPFAEGRNCNLCFETSKKMYTPSKKEVHVCHVGVLHAKIFELLPKEILQQVMEMPTMKKTVSALDRAVPEQQRRQSVELKPLQSQQGTSQKVEASSTQSERGLQNLPPPSPAPTTSQPPAQNFAVPSPRDVVFKLPATNLPSKDDFKMPMVKTDKPYNCRYCVSGFDVAKDLKDHLLTHKSQFSQIQTPRKMNSSLVNLRMNTPRK